MKKLLYILPLLFITLSVKAQDESYSISKGNNDMGFVVRAGYVIGGTAPLPIPAEIRKIEAFKPLGGASIGIDGYKYFNKNWGLMGGLRFFYQGMHTQAVVKNYNMAITMGEDVVEGQFTGTDITDTRMAGLTIPVMASCRLGSRGNINFGPYISTFFFKEFEGSVFDGYLREGNPTGQKIAISSENPAVYDFSDNLRNWACGFELGVDYRPIKNLDIFALLDWGVSDAFNKDFETVAFKMFPIYATIGIGYYY